MNARIKNTKSIATPAINHRSLAKPLAATHDDYMRRYNSFIKRHLNDRMYERETTHGRLKLIGLAFCEAKIVIQVQDIDIVGYERSLALVIEVGKAPIYLLNDCTSIIIASGSWAGEDPLSRLVMIASSGNEVYERHSDVLNPDFDWNALADRILEVLHAIGYPKDGLFSPLDMNIEDGCVDVSKSR